MNSTPKNGLLCSGTVHSGAQQTHIDMHTNKHAYIHACIHILVCVHVHTDIRVHIYVYTHTHTYIHKCASPYTCMHTHSNLSADGSREQRNLGVKHIMDVVDGSQGRQHL